MVLPISDRPVRVGVSASGRWAQMAHLPGWARDPRAELVAVCDVEPQLAEDAAPKFGAPAAASKYRDVVDRDDIDVVDVCTPSHTHFELAMAALEAGKHVLCEKPVAFDFRDTCARRELARAKGLKTSSASPSATRRRCGTCGRWSTEGFVGDAVHLQRLRAELAVARSAESAAAGRSRRGSPRHPGLVARRLRRAGDRHRAPDGRRRSDRRSSARCATSCRSAWSARPAA